MDTIDSLLLNLVNESNDILTWHALADALEEEGGEYEARLCRATIDIRYTYNPNTEEHKKRQAEVQELIKAGVKLYWPTVVGPHQMLYSVIPSGGFLMGESKTPVAITKPFLMGTTQVTQAQWIAVMGTNPSHFQGSGYPDHMSYPVESISWHDCQEFCKKLTEATGLVHRLPTEAEWEYACRAGTTSEYHQGDSEEDLQLVGHYKANHPIAVGSLLPNAFGLYDMHGNVWEWCQDAYTQDPYEGQTVEVTEEEWRRLRCGYEQGIKGIGINVLLDPKEELAFSGLQKVMRGDAFTSIVHIGRIGPYAGSAWNDGGIRVVVDPTKHEKD